MDVLGIGDIDVDIYLEVDRIPGRDEKLVANQYHIFPGGMVGNFVVALSRLGMSCGFHGPVGDDEYGQMAINDLVENKVDPTYVIIKQGGKTYFCVVILDDSGEKALIVAPTDCLEPLEEDISERAIKSARHMHTIYHGPAQLKAIQLAKINNLTVSVDFEPGSIKDNPEVVDHLSLIDIAFINQNALQYLSDLPDQEAAAFDVLSKGPEVVCVTLGSKGSLIVKKNEPEPKWVKAFKVPVIDTTGAGDCFAAGFVYGYLKGWPIELTGQIASATAAIKIMSKGGHAGAPSISQVREFLLENQVHIPKNTL